MATSVALSGNGADFIAFNASYRMEELFNLSSNLSHTTPPQYIDQSQILMYHRPIVEKVNKYITPLWYVIGFPGNLLAFLIWIRRRMRPASGVYLAALALSDLLFLTLQLLFEMEETWGRTVISYPVMCQVFPIFFLAAQYLSPMFVLAFTVERFISICYPFHREKFCSTSRSIKVVIGLPLLSLSMHAIQGYFWHYTYEIEGSKSHCSPRMSVMLGGIRSLYSIWSWSTEIPVFFIVPVAILVLNICVIREMKRISSKEEKRLRTKNGHQKTSATTVMLLIVSFYLIFTTLPVTICYVLYFSFQTGDASITDQAMIYGDVKWQRYLDYMTVRRIIEELCMSHYACNVFIYLATGKLFRKELQILFFSCCCKDKAMRLLRPAYNDIDLIHAKSSMDTNGNAEASFV